jgi:tetratricopeptide (TPR) repeat protein
MVAAAIFRLGCLMLGVLSTGVVVQGQKTSGSGAQIELIQSLIRAQQYDRAIRTIDSALHATPKDAQLWALRGIVLSVKGNDHDALGAFDQALSLSPDNNAALKGAVQLLYQTLDERANLLLERILRKDPNDRVAHEMLATLEAKSGDCRGAVAHFLLSADVMQTHPESLEAYGSCLVETKQPEKAVPVFEQLSSLVPASMPPRYDLSVALVESKQYDAALRVLEPLLAVNPSLPDILSLASEAYEGVRDTPKAVSLLREAIVLNPADPNLYNSFAALCLNHDSFQVGIDMISAGLHHVSSDPSMYISRGLLYAQLADYKRAEADFNTAEQLDARQSVSSVARDLAQLQQNQSDQNHQQKLLLDIRSQIKAHPDDAYLRYLLAKLLMDSAPEEQGEALQSAMVAVKLRPDFVEARDAMTSLYLRSGRYDLAIEQCRLSLTYAPSDSSAMYHLIIALKHAGRPENQGEIESLIQQLSKLKQTSIQQESERKRFKLVEQDRVPH